MWTNDVDAENLVVLLLSNDLNETLFLAEYARFAGSRERKLPDLYVVSLFLCLGFSQTDGSDFRIAISAVRNESQVDWSHVSLAGKMFDSHDSFFGRQVGQQRSWYNITDSVNTFFASLLEFIHLDKSSFDFDLGTFQPETFGVRHPTNGNQKHLRFETNRLALRCFASNLDARLGLLQLFELGINLRFDPTFAEASLEFLRHFFVFQRNDPWQQLNDGRVSTKA